MSKITLAFFASCLLFYSCKEEIEAPVPLHNNYFAVQLGSEYIYELDSVFISDEFEREDTIRYEIKDIVESVFVDGAGRELYRVERYIREKGESSWNQNRVYTAHQNTQRVEVTEGNLSFIKLVFPVAENKRWDGNALNHHTTENYIYRNVHLPMQIGELSFDSTVTVVQREDRDFVFQIYSEEVYAANVGLVSSYHEEIETQQEKRFGHKLIMRLVSYNK